MNRFDLKKVVQRYMNLANQLRDRAINEKVLGEKLVEDLIMIDELSKTGQMTKDELAAVLETISNFEDIYIEIIAAQNNGHTN